MGDRLCLWLSEESSPSQRETSEPDKNSSDPEGRSDSEIRGERASSTSVLTV